MTYYLKQWGWVCDSVHTLKSRGDGLSTLEESLISCGFAGFFEEYEPVFLAKENVYRWIELGISENEDTK